LQPKGFFSLRQSTVHQRLSGAAPDKGQREAGKELNESEIYCSSSISLLKANLSTIASYHCSNAENRLLDQKLSISSSIKDGQEWSNILVEIKYKENETNLKGRIQVLNKDLNAQ
jgi:hypothetical protein